MKKKPKRSCKKPKQRKLPKGLTEPQVLEIVEFVISRVSPKFKYPQFTEEDICQQGRYFAWEAVGRFDPSRILPQKTPKSKREVLIEGLKSFIYRHVRNRLINYIRDNLGRSEGRQNLSFALSLDVVDDHNERSMRNNASISGPIEAQELSYYIIANLPDDMRPEYRKLIGGEPISRNRKQEIRDTVQEILDNMPERNEDAP